jgi:YD repeat-containing protein
MSPPTPGRRWALSIIRPDSGETDQSFAPICVGAACYEQTTVFDFNSAKSDTYTDALGRVAFAHTYDAGYALYTTLSFGYDYLGRQTSETLPDGTHTATATYDLVGRQTAASDPDLGSWSYSYDPNGNELSSADPRGTSGSVYLGYDGLNRHLWTSPNSGGTSPFASYTYDSTTGGNVGIGRLTSETFASGPSQSVSGSYSFTYDARGRATGQTIIIAGASKSFSMGYNDADQQSTLTYSDGDVLSTTFDSNDWLNNISKNLSGTVTSLTDTLTFGNTLGGVGPLTDAHFGNDKYDWSTIYDQTLLPFDTTVSTISAGTTLYDEFIGRDNDRNGKRGVLLRFPGTADLGGVARHATM